MIPEDTFTRWRGELAELSAALASAWEAVGAADATVTETLEELATSSGPLDRAGLRAPLAALFEELARAYLEASPAERARIRGLFDGDEDLLDVLVSWPEVWASEIGSPSDEEPLRLGLALAAIEDQRTDYRELMLSVGNLCRAAREAGVDVAACVREVASTASAEARVGGRSTRDLLLQMAG